ncbi:MAG: metal-dependent hydrolase [Acidobacteriota bacterium]|nr:metal-dependent hydrolase [Acidobacteriota bacterium]
MEPITHFLTGACIGRTGLNRKTAYATLVAVLAAEAADLDVLWGFTGPVETLKHHRGFTHSFIGAPVVAAVVVAVIWLLHIWREQWRLRKAKASLQNTKAPPAPAPAPAKQPVRWWWLYWTALIAALSHILLDWTNNYGVRPFFPFNSRWYAGSIMFIAEPVLWALFFLALVLPWLFGLADREIGARQKPFRGRGWAIFALAGMVTLWCWRWAEHAQALAMLENLQVTSAPAKRIALEPYSVNPFRWHAILETADFYQTAEIDTWTDSIDSDPQLDVLYKPSVTAASEAAKRTFLGQVYLDWGTWAVVRDVGQEPAPGMEPPQLPPGRHWTTIKFTDLRFAYPFLGTGRFEGRTPLAGWVYIVDNHIDAGEAMEGRQQR